MRTGLLVYQDGRLCALEWDVVQNYGAETAAEKRRAPAFLTLMWWPLTEWTPRHRLDQWLGTWNGPQDTFTNTWEGKEIRNYGQGHWYIDASFRLTVPFTMVEGRWGQFMWASAALPFPPPPVPAKYPVEYGTLGRHGVPGFSKLLPSKGWVPVTTHFAVKFEKDADGNPRYRGYFQWLKSDKPDADWTNYDAPVDLAAVAKHVVRDDEKAKTQEQPHG